MTERPILFSAPMVRAVLAGTKTQTRRVVRWKGMDAGLNAGFSGLSAAHYCTDAPQHGWALYSRDGAARWQTRTAATHCPYGVPGDRLWVREAHALENRYRNVWCRYRADDAHCAVPAPAFVEIARPGWRPSIHMFRWASRITLEVSDVRVERLQAISEADAIAEGVEPIPDTGPVAGPNRFSIYIEGGWHNAPTAAGTYGMLWDLINGAGAWDANPWVWVVEFKRLP